MMLSTILAGLTALVAVGSAQTMEDSDSMATSTSASSTASATSSSNSAATTYDVAVGAVWIPS